MVASFALEFWQNFRGEDGDDDWMRLYLEMVDILMRPSSFTDQKLTAPQNFFAGEEDVLAL